MANLWSVRGCAQNAYANGNTMHVSPQCYASKLTRCPSPSCTCSGKGLAAEACHHTAQDAVGELLGSAQCVVGRCALGHLNAVRGCQSHRIWLSCTNKQRATPSQKQKTDVLKYDELIVYSTFHTVSPAKASPLLRRPAALVENSRRLWGMIVRCSCCSLAIT